MAEVIENASVAEVKADDVKGKAAKKADSVEVSLLNSTVGSHIVFHSEGSTTFVDGKGTVSANIAKELKENGIVE